MARATTALMPPPGTASTDPLLGLAHAAVRGDAAAKRSLCIEVGPTILATLRKILGHANPELEDVLHETLLGLFDGLSRFDGGCSVKHFARQIAVHRALTSIRNRRANASKIELVASEWEARGPVLSSRPSAPDRAAVLAERRELLRALLARLPAAQAETLVLQSVFGHSVEEISAALGVAVNTVRGRLVSAKAALRELIRAEPRFADLAELDDED